MDGSRPRTKSPPHDRGSEVAEVGGAEESRLKGNWHGGPAGEGAKRVNDAGNAAVTHGKVGRGGPDVAVVPADDGVLHHLGGEQLVVHVRLPRHGEGGGRGRRRGREEARGWSGLACRVLETRAGVRGRPEDAWRPRKRCWRLDKWGSRSSPWASKSSTSSFLFFVGGTKCRDRRDTKPSLNKKRAKLPFLKLDTNF